jgi:hypothetical protein
VHGVASAAFELLLEGFAVDMMNSIDYPQRRNENDKID